MNKIYRKICNLVFVGLCLYFLSSCAVGPKFIVTNYYRPSRVAVLPMDNQTTDLDGPGYLRELFVKGLIYKGYNVKSIDETDEILRKEGITDAGQLPTITPQELGKLLNVDAVFYSNLLAFNYITLGFYYQRKVHAEFKLIDTHTGEKLWEDEHKATTMDATLSSKEAWEKFKDQMLEKTIEKALRVPLHEESQEVINKVLKTLP